MSTAQKLLMKIGAGSALVAAGVSSAFAAVPTAVGTTLTSIQADGLELAELVWPVLLTLFGAVLLMKLAKRFGSKI